ncbi:hypothetical protein PTE01_27180 [Pseudoalteromonas tetraodonis GFC]|uniref:Uncharacterized protein n=1 Tax=Pseudoalteromonas tetraodonis GFC TaxID=1315271 RepID=A0AA37S1M3_9GAMM|nr:hypothetical protein PTET_a3077 [Pseudoalteromonas tetraodonis]GEN39608.1 hypothetical protein PTE01_27180 [Pseudoalteromonas tetraodonis GFC]GLQ02266.1 hypothetical protein GCM10007914_11470 [Pseudoalteromonas tetraodonis GFC]
MRAIQYFPYFILKSPFAKRFLTVTENKLAIAKRVYVVQLTAKGDSKLNQGV